MPPIPTISQVNERFAYDPETGVLRWRSRGPKRRPGCAAGSIDKDGYVIVGVEYQRYRAHKVIWLMMTGEWPAEEIDHRNRSPGDNRWSNLRAASSQQNKINRVVAKNLSTGILGVHRHPNLKNKPYSSQVKRDGRLKRLGYFATADEAHEAYCIAQREAYGEFFPATTHEL